MLARVVPISDLAKEAGAYLAQTLDTPVRLQPAGVPSRLPFLLHDRYRYFAATVLNTRCIFMVAAPPPEAPTVLAKHHALAASAFGDAVVILLLNAIGARLRRALMAHHVPFVVPHNQLYAPELAIDLRERFRKAAKPVPALSPSAQIIVLSRLRRRDIDGETPTRLAKVLRTTAMSMSRAFDELEACGLADIAQVGKERRIMLTADRRALWDKAQPLLRSPVRKRRDIENAQGRLDAVFAGGTALAHYTSLSGPGLTYAVSARDWKYVASQAKLAELDAPSLGSFVIETWAYDPRSLSETEYADPVSLYLSVRDDTDERVRIAAQDLLEGFLHARL
jgi:DNA-binding MarR family transcriptional regulator